MLLLEPGLRRDLWQAVGEVIENYVESVSTDRVAPPLDPDRLRSLLARFDFNSPTEPREAIEFAARNLRDHQVHVPHPRYFGMFNPAPATMGILGDALAAAFNPQLAVWSHNPFAVEVERHLVRAFAGKFGCDPDGVEGTLCAGGMEANHTAVLTALTRAYPRFTEEGVRSLDAEPVLYVTRESHDSFKKAARLCGLGTRAAVPVPTDRAGRMDPAALHDLIRRDRAEGRNPFMVVATIGTTAGGFVDPLEAIVDIAARAGLWCHTDAAWGGAAALVPELRHLVRGIERADSVTFDAHKWFSVPMGAGIYFTRHAGLLEKTFRVGDSYMPRDARHLDVTDPYAASMQWSRRFIGLKIFLPLAAAGWSGYEETIRHMTAMGALMKDKLEGSGWELVNESPLPLACFFDATRPDGRSAEYLQAVCDRVLASGQAWISMPRILGGQPALRACICNYRTEPGDIEFLVSVLDQARRAVAT
ncbi:MAG: pyridoxal-dependent decarboxylase [Planctomycetes bacterium]|nr:pyridoxal-dependent decarboxylase [Planctomycetota bacterium]